MMSTGAKKNNSAVLPFCEESGHLHTRTVAANCFLWRISCCSSCILTVKRDKKKRCMLSKFSLSDRSIFCGKWKQKQDKCKNFFWLPAARVRVRSRDPQRKSDSHLVRLSKTSHPSAEDLSKSDPNRWRLTRRDESVASVTSKFAFHHSLLGTCWCEDPSHVLLSLHEGCPLVPWSWINYLKIELRIVTQMLSYRTMEAKKNWITRCIDSRQYRDSDRFQLVWPLSCLELICQAV